MEQSIRVVTLGVADLERTRAFKDPQDAPLFGGYQGYFGDPDGHLWDVVYNPGLWVADDGTVVLGSP